MDLWKKMEDFSQPLKAKPPWSYWVQISRSQSALKLEKGTPMYLTNTDLFGTSALLRLFGQAVFIYINKITWN